LSAVLQDVHNNYDSDLFMTIIGKIHTNVGKIDITASRVIADHIRSAVFLIVDQVYPSNEGRGYVLRRIIRRAMAFAYREGVKEPFLHQLTQVVIDSMGGAYPELITHADVITQVIKDEELRFHTTIMQGMRILQKNIEQKIDIDGKTAFMMYDTYGFPLDIAKDIAKKHGLNIDESGYKEHMLQQQNRSRERQTFQNIDNTQLSLSTRTEFIGHGGESCASTVENIICENALASEMSEGMTATLVAKATPFYPEGGGQVGDQGLIVGSSGQFKVLDTQKQGGTILHIGELVSGRIALGDEVTLTVDPKP
jgi:alanyl-tRNA synthetase